MHAFFFFHVATARQLKTLDLTTHPLNKNKIKKKYVNLRLVAFKVTHSCFFLFFFFFLLPSSSGIVAFGHGMLELVAFLDPDPPSVIVETEVC